MNAFTKSIGEFSSYSVKLRQKVAAALFRVLSMQCGAEVILDQRIQSRPRFGYLCCKFVREAEGLTAVAYLGFTKGWGHNKGNPLQFSGPVFGPAKISFVSQISKFS